MIISRLCVDKDHTPSKIVSPLFSFSLSHYFDIYLMVPASQMLERVCFLMVTVH